MLTEGGGPPKLLPKTNAIATEATLEFSQANTTKLLLPAVVGFLAGLYLQWWKSARDERRILGDEACKVARMLIDAAADYWMEPDSIKQKRLEPRIIGHQTELSDLIHILHQEMLYSDRADLKAALKKLIRIVTGESFGDRNDSGRNDLAHGVHYAGAKLINGIRVAQSRRNTLLGAVMAFMGW